MSETARDGKDRRHARIAALTDSQRRSLLAYLCDSAPEAVDRELDRLEGDWRRWQAAEQATEDVHVIREGTIAGPLILDPRYTPPWPDAGIKSARKGDASGTGTGREPEDDND